MVHPYQDHTSKHLVEDEAKVYKQDTIRLHERPPDYGHGFHSTVPHVPQSPSLPPRSPDIPPAISTPRSPIVPTKDDSDHGKDNKPGLQGDYPGVSVDNPNVNPTECKRPTRLRRLPRHLHDYLLDLK